MAKIESVLFVCWANVCRSPAAELILKRELARRGMRHVQIKSAGVDADYEVYRPSWAMKLTAFFHGLRLGRRPRLFRKFDCTKYDLVIAMDREVQHPIRAIAGNLPPNVKLLSDFMPQDWPADVPDPMNQSVVKCHLVLNMIDCACRVLSEHICLAESGGRFSEQLFVGIPESMIRAYHNVATA